MKAIRLLTVFGTIASLLQAEQPEIIAHRGASVAAPENTVAAFREAWKQEADGIELDVWLTKDGRIVVIHDETTRRTTNADRMVRSTLLKDLRALDAGIWMGEKWKGEPIPTLEEALAILPKGKTIFIEIKCGPEILPEFARVIAASGTPLDSIYIIDFKFDSLVKVKALIPGVKLFWLVGGTRDKLSRRKTYPNPTKLAEKASTAGFYGLNLDEGFGLDAASVRGIKAKGLVVAVWTVNAPQNARHLAALGVDVITTDQPALIRTSLK